MDFEPGFETDYQKHERPGRHEGFRPASAVTFEMRCPNCRKLYSVTPQVFTPDEDDVIKFECVSCESTFLAVKPDSLTTRLLETQLAPLADWNERPIVRAPREETAPSANKPARAAIAAVPLRPHPVEDFEIAGSAEILALWDSVVEKYEDLSRHTVFLNRCLEDQKLVFASRKYAQVLMVDPQDKIARRMRAEVQGLASFEFDAGAKGLSPATWVTPLPSFMSFICFLGGIAVVVGLGLPHQRAVAAVGAAMVAITAGLRYFLRRPN